MYRRFLKRIIDLILAIIVFSITLPIHLIAILLLAVQNNGSVFFFQDRPGKGEKIFRIIKLKTMNDKKDASGKLLPDNIRLTKVGRFIRKLSIDELPQLFNVIKGDMSLIGPRPLLIKYLPLYSESQRRRHDVRPGITGWAQVNGRNSISWAKKFELDVYYVDHLSMSLDFKIVLLTIKKVIKREGVNQSESRPMQPFDGTN